ncbi:MAG: hypothetical protein HY518_05740 [Candidatus Aenigmarchaeota archaeon]|nr:hypothetical protein [Candidatus Aenigmarchaeota archaeon]
MALKQLVAELNGKGFTLYPGNRRIPQGKLSPLGQPVTVTDFNYAEGSHEVEIAEQYFPYGHGKADAFCRSNIVGFGYIGNRTVWHYAIQYYKIKP